MDDSVSPIYREYKQLSKLLKSTSCAIITFYLKQYSNEEPCKRLQLALEQYFLKEDSNISYELLMEEATILQNIFPHVTVDSVLEMLKEIGNEDNRMRIVAKKLLKQENNLKRTLPHSTVDSDILASKKCKVASAVSSLYEVASNFSENIDNESHDAADDTVVSLAASHSKPMSTISLENILDNDMQEETKNITQQILQPQPLSQLLQPASTLIIPKKGGDNWVVKKGTETRRRVLPLVEKQMQELKTKSSILLENISSVLRQSSASNFICNIDFHRSELDRCSNLCQDIVQEIQKDISQIQKIKRDHNQSLLKKTVVNKPTGKTASTSLRNQIKQNKGNTNKLHKVDLLTSAASIPSSSQIKQDKGNTKIFTSTPLTSETKQSKGNTDKLDKDDFLNIKVDALIHTENNTKVFSWHNNLFKNNVRSRSSNDKMNEGFIGDNVDGDYHFNFDAIEKDTTPINKEVPNNAYKFDFNDINLGNDMNKAAGLPLNPNTSQFITIDDSVNEDLELLNQVLEDISPINNDPQKNQDPSLEETSNFEIDENIIYRLMEMFPDACTTYLRNICRGLIYNVNVMDDIITKILSDENYPKRQQRQPSPTQELHPEEQYEIFRQVLPNADPTYLRLQAERLSGNSEAVKHFIADALENPKYPTKKDYLRKQKISAQQKQYTTHFNVKKFLEVIQDPKNYFNNQERKASVTDVDIFYAQTFLKNKFAFVTVRTINQVFKENNHNLVKTCQALENTNDLMRAKRKTVPMPDAGHNIPLLQEIAYITHRDDIVAHIKEEEVKRQKDKEEAKNFNLLQSCGCCYDDEVMPCDIFKCDNGCSFCRTCIQKSSEIAFGEGKLEFPCLNECSSHFSLQTLQSVLQPKMFSKIAQKKQLEEIKAAGIEDLEMCPFCEFATIPPSEDKIFKCLNEDCMKESCRLCKEPSHIPFHCDEVEKDDDVRVRVFIENKMTEALVRVCYKCQMKFIKADGCNKMTCSCGAMMCYVCGQPVKDYKHFNGPGGDNFHLCALYSDTNKLHQEQVLMGAEKAKAEIAPEKKLLYDPTMDVQQHYNEMSKKHPVPHFLNYNQHPQHQVHLQQLHLHHRHHHNPNMFALHHNDRHRERMQLDLNAEIRRLPRAPQTPRRNPDNFM